MNYVLPNAKIIFIERDEEDCLRSNLERTNKSHGLNMNKYLYKSNPDNYNMNEVQTVKNTLLIHEQVHYSQIFNFGNYFFTKLLHKKRNIYPFGPKLYNYDKIIKNNGAKYYHEKCIEQIKHYKKIYSKLFTDIFFIRLEDVENRKEKLFEFIEYQKKKNI